MTPRKHFKETILQIATPLVRSVADKIQNWEFARTFLEYLGGNLVLKNNISTSDIIVVLGGGSIQRVRTAAQLYQKGIAHKLLIYRNISRNKFINTNKPSTIQEAIRLGVNMNDIIHQNTPRTTREEAVNFSKIVIKFDFRSATIITDPYHMRRVNTLFQHFIDKSEFRINLYSTGREQFNPNIWWHKNEDTHNLISEYLALMETLLKLNI